MPGSDGIKQYSGSAYPSKDKALAAGMLFAKQAQREGFVGLKLKVYQSLRWYFSLHGDLIHFYPSEEAGRVSVVAGTPTGGSYNFSPEPAGRTYATFKEAYDAVLACCDLAMDHASMDRQSIKKNWKKPSKPYVLDQEYSQTRILRRDTGAVVAVVYRTGTGDAYSDQVIAVYDSLCARVSTVDTRTERRCLDA